MISRPGAIDRVLRMFLIHPVAAILGPRQCGKTTLARMLAERQRSSYYDLENPTDAQRLSNPLQAMESLSGLIIIDEIQRKPQLFEILRVLADRPANPVRFLVLGSASPTLIKGISESLAGRVGLIDMSGFNLSEVGVEQQERLWVCGGFPRSYLAIRRGRVKKPNSGIQFSSKMLTRGGRKPLSLHNTRYQHPGGKALLSRTKDDTAAYPSYP